MSRLKSEFTREKQRFMNEIDTKDEEISRLSREAHRYKVELKNVEEIK